MTLDLMLSFPDIEMPIHNCESLLEEAIIHYRKAEMRDSEIGRYAKLIKFADARGDDARVAQLRDESSHLAAEWVEYEKETAEFEEY